MSKFYDAKAQIMNDTIDRISWHLRKIREYKSKEEFKKLTTSI